MPRINPGRKSSLIISSLIILIGIMVYFILIKPQREYYNAHYVKINGTYLLKPIEIQDFELTDTRGKKFTKENLKNRWSLLFFGFTHCELVCPTTLSSLSQMYRSLQKKLSAKNLPQVVFISIDPERDTLKKMNQYLSAFNSQFIGARTTIEKTTALEKEFHIIATGDQSTINHSAEILLINPDAKIQAYFSYPPKADQLEKDYHSILNNFMNWHTKSNYTQIGL